MDKVKSWIKSLRGAWWGLITVYASAFSIVSVSLESLTSRFKIFDKASGWTYVISVSAIASHFVLLLILYVRWSSRNRSRSLQIEPSIIGIWNGVYLHKSKKREVELNLGQNENGMEAMITTSTQEGPVTQTAIAKGLEKLVFQLETKEIEITPERKTAWRSEIWDCIYDFNRPKELIVKISDRNQSTGELRAIDEAKLFRSK